MIGQLVVYGRINKHHGVILLVGFEIYRVFINLILVYECIRSL